MTRPVLLDLFCCAGGAAMGYWQSGFDIVGMDIDLQPQYPFHFMQYDVMKLTPEILSQFSAIHASPPCQGYSSMRNAPGTKGAPLLINDVRLLLEASGRPYIIENVESAKWSMLNPILLCGSMFNLGTEGHELRRHRLFESNVTLHAPKCQHSKRPVIGVYGAHARRRAQKHGGRGTRDIWKNGHRSAMSEAMGIAWMSCEKMSEAIPPAYTHFLGLQLIQHVL